jgi:hypothetical protein
MHRRCRDAGNFSKGRAIVPQVLGEVCRTPMHPNAAAHAVASLISIKRVQLNTRQSSSRLHVPAAPVR